MHYRHIGLATLLMLGGASFGCSDSDSDSDSDGVASDVTVDAGVDDGAADGAGDGDATLGDTENAEEMAAMVDASEPSTADAATSEDDTDAEATDAPDIVAVATDAGTFTQLIQLLTDADLVETLQGTGPFTVFAPSDDAFEAFAMANPGALEGLTPEALASVLTYHVIPGRVAAADLVSGAVVTTVQGAPLAIDLTDGASVGGASVVTADIAASNGVIHVIDTVLLPPSANLVDTAVAAGDFETLTGALTATGLSETLAGEGPYTVFAPTDAAFAALEEGLLESLSTEELTNVLLYHVVSGAVGAGDLSAGEVPSLLEGAELTVATDPAVTINGAAVTTANIMTSNGVIHVIDAVLLPPAEE